VSQKDTVIEPKAAQVNLDVQCESSQGGDLHARLLRLSRHEVLIEVLTPGAALRVSEILPVFKISAGERQLYSGRAVLASVLESGANLICEARLDDTWLDFHPASNGNSAADIRQQFGRFMGSSQGARIPSELKLVLADMQQFLQDLRRWTEQVEVTVLAEPSKNRSQLERELITGVSGPALPVLGALFERFEECCRRLNPAEAADHAFYIKRQLHPLVLCAPFMYRTFRKPLGYAGDYEMVNMMLRDPLEGGSMFAKLLNAFFLATPPVVAHQNRITYLIDMLSRELGRAWASHRRARVFNIGCGPAREVQELIAASEISNCGEFTLLDFNEETLLYTQKQLTERVQRHGRATGVNLVRKSVAQLLKEAARTTSTTGWTNYDVVYCAGLFDYIPQNVCHQLMNLFYRMLRPGGLLVATNVAACNPSIQWMELAVDWHLIYRDARQMEELIPTGAAREDAKLLSDDSGVNTFVEVRKPTDG
jgi:extracellular factor (EF) 3-hydroxypalmitic acid methyl ester biosynthesis protein